MKLAGTFGALFVLIAVIVACVATGHVGAARLLGSLPVTLLVAVAGFGIDVKRARRAARR